MSATKAVTPAKAPGPASEKLASQAKSKKRSREDDGGAKKKKKSKKSEYEQEELLFDMEAGVNKAIALMDSQLLADHIAQKTSRFNSDKTAVELADLYISPNSIKDTTEWTEIRNLEKLPDFLEKFAKEPERLSEAPKVKGSPHTIVVTGAGLRAADIVRALRKYQNKNSTVAKLFAKHIKLQESVDFLTQKRTGVAVGTPKRLSDLVDNGALKLDRLERLVVDASHIDQKKRGILDMKEVMNELGPWLTRKELKDRYTDSAKPIHLLFY